VELNELKPEGNVSDLCKRLSKQKEDSVILVVGHNPLLVDLADDVINPENHHATNFSLKTGGLIKIKTTSLEPKLKGQLEWLLSPKLIRKVSK
jgi:phosphohistidine phosphatase